MTTNRRTARVAGLLYLIVVATGIFSLAYVPGQTIVPGDAGATAERILAHETLYRLGIVGGAVCYVAFLLLPLALYRLLSPTSRTAAVLMVAFAVASVPISFVNLVHKLDALSLLRGADHLHAFSRDQFQAMAMSSLEAYRNGLLVSKVFWGLWLLPFGYLVFKSGLLPKLLGVLLMAGCFGYLIDFTCRALFPDYAQTAAAGYVTLPASIGEIGTCLWLLIVGARETGRQVGKGAAAQAA